MKNAVLDSYAVLVFLFKESGHQIILDLFEKAIEADKPLLIAAPNWAEVRYIVERKVGSERWKETRSKLLWFADRNCCCGPGIVRTGRRNQGAA